MPAGVKPWGCCSAGHVIVPGAGGRPLQQERRCVALRLAAFRPLQGSWERGRLALWAVVAVTHVYHRTGMLRLTA